MIMQSKSESRNFLNRDCLLGQFPLSGLERITQIIKENNRIRLHVYNSVGVFQGVDIRHILYLFYLKKMNFRRYTYIKSKNSLNYPLRSKDFYSTTYFVAYHIYIA